MSIFGGLIPTVVKLYRDKETRTNQWRLQRLAYFTLLWMEKGVEIDALTDSKRTCSARALPRRR